MNFQHNKKKIKKLKLKNPNIFPPNKNFKDEINSQPISLPVAILWNNPLCLNQ